MDTRLFENCQTRYMLSEAPTRFNYMFLNKVHVLIIYTLHVLSLQVPR